MTTPRGSRQSSGASGPAYAAATPRADPIPAASANGPAAVQLRLAWDAYAGTFTGPLTKLADQPDLNVIANRCSPIVRTGVDFLFGPVLKMQHPTPEAQAILDAVWGDDDKRMTMLAKTRINGGVYGHNFVKIVTPRNKRPMSAQNPPRLVVQNPELYTVETDPQDCELVTRYICTWSGTDKDGNSCLLRQTTTRIDPDGDDDSVASGEDQDTTWEIQNWIQAGAAGDGGDWEPFGAAIPWRYPDPPIEDWQNYPNPNAHWGARDIDESIVNLNRALHLVESNTNSINYSQGHPWVFNTGDGDTSAVTPTPGVITDVPGGNITAISASGDISAGMAFADQIRSDMDEASSTPGVATGRMADLPKGAISGITLRLLYGPRIMRTEHERRLYGAAIREISRRVLILCGQSEAAREEIELVWQDPLPQDDLALGQLAVIMQQIGFSQHTVFALFGKDYDTEREYLQQEAADQLTAFAHGQGMPPAQAPAAPPMQMQPASAGQPQAGDGSSNGSGATGAAPNGQMPPTNHPAAVAQRNATAAVAKLMKGGGA